MKRILVALATLLFASFTAPTTSSASGIDGYLVADDAHTGQIFRLDQLGGDLTQLTHLSHGDAAIAPRWSPDGQHIAFVIFGRHPNRMFTMDRNGHNLHLLRADSPAWNNDVPDYFPNGRRVAFARCHSDGTGCVIATARVDGTHLRTLTSTGFEEYDFYPDVSPDGDRIAYTKTNANGVHGQVWIMNSDGTGAHPVTAPALEGWLPRWTADGTALIVSSNCCRLGGNLYRLPVDGGPATPLTHTLWPNFSDSAGPAPSGREIAFVTDRNYSDKCCTDLYVMRSDGGHQVKVDIPLTGVRDVDWGPSPLG